MAITKEKYIAPTTTFNLIAGEESMLAGGASGTGSDIENNPEKGETDPIPGGGSFPDDARFEDNSFDFGSWDF